MSAAYSKNKFFLAPSKLRIIFIISNLIICWGAVFYKARATESLPWSALLIVTFFILGILAFEVIISFRFTEYLAFAVYGFLLGAGINIIIQGLLNRFQGLNWAFQSPILFSLGTLLLGFLGTIIFISYGEQITKNIPWESLAKNQRKTEGNIRKFITLIWIITSAVALGLCANLLIILRIFNSPGTDNPLRKPLWFSLGIIIFVFMISALARKKIMSIGTILLPGLIIGLIWASIFRDMFEWVYLKYPEFPLSSEVLEVLLIINFCYLGTAWLNKALYSSQQKRRDEIS